MLRTILPIFTAIVITGCTASGSREFHRQADLIEAREAFQARKEACRKVGRTAYIKADATRVKRQRSDEYDYKFAGCD